MARGENVTQFEQGNGAGHELLKKIARTAPHYDRNRAHVCSFFARGQCTRGDECPYRHEMPPEESDLSHQNIKDRFHGDNDPVAKRILGRTEKMAKQSAPDDQSITSIFLSGVEPGISEGDLRDYFYAFGEIKSVVISHQKKCAFINYTTRVGAEQAMEKSASGVNISGKILKVAWGRAQRHGPKSDYGLFFLFLSFFFHYLTGVHLSSLFLSLSFLHSGYGGASDDWTPDGLCAPSPSAWHHRLCVCATSPSPRLNSRVLPLPGPETARRGVGPAATPKVPLNREREKVVCFRCLLFICALAYSMRSWETHNPSPFLLPPSSYSSSSSSLNVYPPGPAQEAHHCGG